MFIANRRAAPKWIIAAALAAAAPAHAQPEWVRLDAAAEVHSSPWMDAEGDLLTWSASPGRGAGLFTYIYRRTETGWAQEAEFHVADRQEEWAFTAIDGNRIVVWPGRRPRIYRHDGASWIEEPIDYGGNALWLPGELAVGLSGEWLVAPRAWSSQGREGLAVLFRFDGAVWRYHSRLFAQIPDGHVAFTAHIEEDLIAIQTLRWISGEFAEPGPVLIFRLIDDAWRHHATISGPSWWAALGGGRIATVHEATLRVYSKVAPGAWEPEVTLVAPYGGFGLCALDGERLVTTEVHQGPHLWERDRRAVVYERTASGWELVRALYPSGAYTGEFGSVESAALIRGPVALAGGGVFGIATEHGWGGGGDWRIVGFPACRADFNGDGVADFADLLAFLEGRERGMLSADYDMDGMIGDPWYWDEGDFLEFMRVLEEGC